MFHIPGHQYLTGIKNKPDQKYLTQKYKLSTGNFPIIPGEKFFILTLEGKTGTPVFQKTRAKEIKKLQLQHLFLTVFKKSLFLPLQNRG